LDQGNGLNRREDFAVATFPNPGKKGKTAGRRALRGGAALAIVAMLAGSLYLVAGFEQGRPNFYQPARAPLIDTAIILSEIDAEEEELGGKFQTLHSRLDDAIALLDQAERLDPEDKRQIATMQMRLLALEKTERMASTYPATLERTYRRLTEQLNTLARRLEQRPPT